MPFFTSIFRSLLCAVALTLPVGAIAADATAAYLDAAAEQLPSQAQSALQSINGVSRRLLATRAYLRADKVLVARWSWTAEQIKEYENSAQYQALLDAIAAVNYRFAAQNPGYSVFANTQVRSLDLQIQRWNQNRGVGIAADGIHQAALAELRGNYPAVPDNDSTQRFVTFLRNLTSASPVPLAAPGLSLHGQSRVIDFQVRKDGKTVAGPEVASVADVWEKQGWARKLQRAVDPAQGVFAGPLKSPNEPWHYEYVQ
jgi:hypothetical protein